MENLSKSETPNSLNSSGPKRLQSAGKNRPKGTAASQHCKSNPAFHPAGWHDSIVDFAPITQLPEVIISKKPTAPSLAGLKPPIFELPTRTPSTNYPQESEYLSEASENTSSHGELVGIISLTPTVPKPSLQTSGGGMFSFETARVRPSQKRSNIILEPRVPTRNEVSSENVMLHSFIYPGREGSEPFITQHTDETCSESSLLQQQKSHKPLTATHRQSLPEKYPSISTGGEIDSGNGIENSVTAMRDYPTDVTTSSNSRILVTEKNSSVSLFVQRLMSHISTKMVASSDVSMMSQNSVVYTDKDGQTEIKPMKEFSDNAAGLQLAFVRGLDSGFQLRKYFLYLKSYAAKTKFKRNKDALSPKIQIIWTEDRQQLRREIDNQFAGVLMELSQESTCTLIRSSHSNATWSTDSLQRYFTALTEQCSNVMLKACLKIDGLLKHRFDISNRSLSEKKRQLFAQLLILKKENEAHAIAAADLNELVSDFFDAQRRMFAWMHKLLINIVQTLHYYFSIHHVEIESALALVCTWSTDHEIVLSPDISKITAIYEDGVKLVHYVIWNIFTTHCGSDFLSKNVQTVAPHAVPQLHEMKRFHSEFASNWFIQTSVIAFRRSLIHNFDEILRVVKSDALLSVNQAKIIEIELASAFNPLPQERIASLCNKYYQDVQDSFKRLELAPSNFHRHLFCLNITHEYVTARRHLQKVWDSQFTQLKQRTRLQIEHLAQRIYKNIVALRSIDLFSKKDDEIISSAFQLHHAIVCADDALIKMGIERKMLLLVTAAIIACSPDSSVQYWTDFETTVHFKTLFEECANAKKAMLQVFERMISLFDSGHDEYSLKLRLLNNRLEEIDSVTDFSASNVFQTCDDAKHINDSTLGILTEASSLFENYKVLCVGAVLQSKDGKRSDMVLRRTPEDIVFVATILAEKSQSCLNDWRQLLEMSEKLERTFATKYKDACNGFLAFQNNLDTVGCECDESISTDLVKRFTAFHSERINYTKTLYPFLKISSVQIRMDAFNELIRIILPPMASSSEIDESVTFGEILSIWQSVSEEQSMLIRERMKVQSQVAEKVVLAQSSMETANSIFTWKSISAFQEVRFPQFLGHVSVFINPNTHSLMDSCEAQICNIFDILSTFPSAVEESRIGLSHFLEDLYVLRSFLQNLYACSYWSCCMLTITFERRGDENEAEFLTWGGDPDQLGSRNAAIKAYQLCMVFFFQQSKAFAKESLLNQLSLLRELTTQLNEVTVQMRSVYENYRDFTFFPLSLTWFPSIILIDEDIQDSAILSLGPAGSSTACGCFSSLMDAAKKHIFVNVSRITKDKEFGQPSTITTLCGRTLSVGSSTQLFGRSINLSLLLQARSVKNAFRNFYLQIINKFDQNTKPSFLQLLSSANLKETFLECIVLAILVKLSGIDRNDRNCPFVPELLESLQQVAKDAADGNVHSVTALSHLVMLRDSCSTFALRGHIRWKFNYEEQSLRIEAGSSLSISHNIEISPNLDWLLFLASGDSYLIKCIESVALSPRVLETPWDHKTHSHFSKNLASLTGRQLSIRNVSSAQMEFWISAITAAKGFGILISDVNHSISSFPFQLYLANVLRVGSIFWWASKYSNGPLSDIPNVLSASSLLPFFNFSEFEEASVQLDCVHRTFCILPPNVSIIRAAQGASTECNDLLQSFGKLSCKLISCTDNQNVILSKHFLQSRANLEFDSCFERFSKLTPSNANNLLSSNTNRGAAHEVIRMWINERQKIVISGPALAGKSTIIAKALEESVKSGSIVQRFYWDGLVPMSDSITPEDLEHVQLHTLSKFYSNKSTAGKAIAWIDCPDFSTFPYQLVAEYEILPFIVETQCVSHLDPASLCACNHYFIAIDEMSKASDVLLENMVSVAESCFARKKPAQKLIHAQTVHKFFMESLRFVHQHCQFGHNMELPDIHYVRNFLVLIQSYCSQMTASRCSTFGSSWWKNYNLCSETAFYHISVYCTIWSIGSCLPHLEQDKYDIWVRTLGFGILNVQSLVDLKISSAFRCILAPSVASNGLRLECLQDFEILERFAALGDAGLFCPTPRHYICREIIRVLSSSGHTVALLGPSESGKSLFLNSLRKHHESLKIVTGCSFVSFESASSSFHNIKALAGCFRDSSKFTGPFNIIIDDFHLGFEKSRINERFDLEASQVYGIIRSFMCSRTICLVDQVKSMRFNPIARFREPVPYSVSMTLGVSTSAPQYAAPQMHTILASSFLLQPDFMPEQTFQVLCSRTFDMKLRKLNRIATTIVEVSVPIMASVLHQAHALLVKNMKKLLLPNHYDIPTYSYFTSMLLRLVDTFGCTQKQADIIYERKKQPKAFDFLSYVRAATSGLQKAKQAVATSVQSEYYLDSSSVWKAFAIHFRDLASHFLSSNMMFEIEHMMEESYFSEISKSMSLAMASVGCDHGGQLDAIFSPIAKYVLGSEPDHKASFILKSLPGDVTLQSYQNMWIKYTFESQEFKFKTMLAMIQSEHDVVNNLSQMSGAFHQLAHFLKFQDPLLRIRCYNGSDVLNIVELCESLKVFRHFSIRHIDILDDAKEILRSEIRNGLQEDHYVVFVMNLQFNRYLETSHTTAEMLHRVFHRHVEILHALVIEKKPLFLFHPREVLEMANRVCTSTGKQAILSLEAASTTLASEFANRFKFVIAVDAIPQISVSMHEEYFKYKKLRLNSSVCSLFAASIPSTYVLINIFRQYKSYELACDSWKENGLTAAGIPMASLKMAMTGYFLFTASILNHLAMNSIFEIPHVSTFLQQNTELCNIVCVKFMFYLQLFRDQFAFCIERLQKILKGINTIINIHAAAEKEFKTLNAELLQKNEILESLQAKFKVERDVLQKASVDSDQGLGSRQVSAGVNENMHVSSLFSSSSYGSSILATSRCLNEIQKLSDVEAAKVSKAISEPKNLEERLISELVLTVFQYTQMGLTPATFSKSVGDFKYKLASLSVVMLPASSLELMMRYIRNPVLQLSDNPFYHNRLGVKLLMEWIQSLACQIYCRKKSEELSQFEDNSDTVSFVASVLKKQFFLEDAAGSLNEKIELFMETLKQRIQEIKSALGPLHLVLTSVKLMEPLLNEIKTKAKTNLRKLFKFEQFSEEMSYMYSLISVVCLPFCKENQDNFFDIIADLASDESLTRSLSPLHTIFSRFAVTISRENPISFQFLLSTNVRDFISLCATILNAKDTQFLFCDDLYRFSDMSTTDERFLAHAITSMSSTRMALILQDAVQTQHEVPSIYADVSLSDLELQVMQNKPAFSHVISSCSEVAKFGEAVDQLIEKSSSTNSSNVFLTSISTNASEMIHDPLYSMESVQKIKEYASRFAFNNAGTTTVFDGFRLVLTIDAYSVLKSISLEGLPMTGFQIVNCYDFEKRFANTVTHCLMNSVDKRMSLTLSNIRKSFSEFTMQKVSSLLEVCSNICELQTQIGGFEGELSGTSSVVVAELVSRNKSCAASYRKLMPLLDACIESLVPCLQFESNWREISQIVTQAIVWLLSGTNCISSLQGLDWKASVPKLFLLHIQRSPPPTDPMLTENYRGNQTSKLANQIARTLDESLRFCMSGFNLEYTMFFDIVANLVSAMTANLDGSWKSSLESFQCSTNFSFMANISYGLYFFKLQLPMGPREMESSRNACLKVPRSFWSSKLITHELIDSNPDYNATPDYEFGQAPVEIRTIFVLMHLLSFGDTQLDKYDVENPMITVVDLKKSNMPECVVEKRLYIMRFMNIYFAEKFDLFVENLRLLNLRPKFVEEFGQIHSECFLSLLKRQRFSENTSLVSLLRSLFVSNFGLLNDGLVASFLLGNTSFFTTLASYSCLISPVTCLGTKRCQTDCPSIVETLNENRAVAFQCCSKIEVQVVKDSIVKQFCNNVENPQLNHRIIKINSLSQAEIRDLFKNFLTTPADERLIIFIEDLDNQSWIWTGCDLLSRAIQNLSAPQQCNRKIICFLEPYINSSRCFSEVRSIFSNGSKSSVVDVKFHCASLHLHMTVLPTNESRLLNALAVVQWILYSRFALHAGSVNACGHFPSESLLLYKGPIHSLFTAFDSLESDGLNSSDVVPLLCEDLLSNGVHEYDVLLYRQLFLDFASGKIDFDNESSFDSSFAAVPSSRSLMYHLSETVCAHLVIKVLKPSFFWLCSKQDDVAFFNENSMKFTKDIKENRGKCLELKTKLQEAVAAVERFLPDALSEQQWVSTCSKIPSHLYPDLLPFLKMDGLILITSLNKNIDKIFESTANILKYIKNETDLTFSVNADAGHLNLGIVPVSWDQFASNIFVQYLDYLRLLQTGKKVFDFVCMQLESLGDMVEEVDQRLTIISAGVAIRSFSAYIAPNFSAQMASSCQDMISLLGKTTRLASIREWAINNSDDSELLFWTPVHQFHNQLRKEVLSPTTLHFDSIQEFVRDSFKRDVDWKFANQDPSAITAYFSIMLTKPMSQLFIYDKATYKARPCGQNCDTAGSSAVLSEVMQIFHPMSEVLFLKPDVLVQGRSVETVMQGHFLCPLFRTPSCGIDIHKNLPHAFNNESAPTWKPTREFLAEGKQRKQPILNILFPSVDGFRLQSSMAAAVMFQSKVPPQQDKIPLKAWVLDSENARS